ncbi:hypothetical protein D3C81_1295980 [compost metagenome]
MQLLGKIGEAAGEDGRLVAQALELGEQRLGAFGQAQRSTDLVQYANVQTLEQRQALLEAGTEIQLAAHGPLGDFGNLLAYTGGLGQLVNDFGFDQRRVHVEHRQAAVATEQRILLEGDVDVQFLGDAEELGAQGLRISRLATYRELDAALALLSRRIQCHTTRQAIDMVDIQAVLGRDRADALQLFGSDLAGQQGDDMSGLALTFDPILVVGFGNRGKTYLLVEFVARKQDVLEHR